MYFNNDVSLKFLAIMLLSLSKPMLFTFSFLFGNCFHLPKQTRMTARDVNLLSLVFVCNKASVGN